MPHERRRIRAAAVILAAVAAGIAALPGSGTPDRANAGPVYVAVADALVTSAQPRRNFGRARRLEGDRRPLVRSYLRFRIDGLAGPVRSATLRLFATRTRGGRYGVASVRKRAWSERGITFANAPRVGRTIRTVAVAAPGWSEADVTPLVSGNGTIELVLTGPRGVVSFASRETGSRAPRLVVDSVSPGDPTIAAAGNVACDPIDPNFNGGLGTSDACRQKATSDLLAGEPLAAVLALGDLQYECGGPSAYARAYGPTWGRVKAITRPVPGNHEHRSTLPGTECPQPRAEGYFGYFGPVAGEIGKGWYSFDVGRWHLIALNSNCADAGGCGAGSAQLEWLQRDLAANRSFCTLAYWHAAKFSSSYASQQDTRQLGPFWDALGRAGADLVLGAHDHVYERFAPQDASGTATAGGMREFVVGTGGRDHHPFFTTLRNSQVRNNDTFGVLRLTLHPASYDWRFVPEAGQSFTDAGSATCH